MNVIFSMLLFFLTACVSLWGNDPLAHWCMEEADVLNQARQNNKPIVLAFVGRDFCPWSQKMIGEVLGQETFVEKIKPQAILWQYTLHAEGNSKEDRMREKYKIDECPTILLLDPKGREFARFGYLPLDKQGFADQLLEVVADFKEICLALDEHRGKNDANAWLEFYRKAKQFSSIDFKKLVLERGVQEDPGTELLIEKYAFLLERNKIKSPAARECKEMLIQRDPENRHGTHLKIAMAEFHKSASAENAKKSPRKVLKPLLHYLELFEEKDKDNIWNIEMVIANYLFGAQKKESALEYAKKAYIHAPETMKESIAASIAFIESK
jgi:protein disulfide-isomerase